MDIDWDRRRRNLRVLMALADTNATRLAREADLTVNSVRQFLSGAQQTFSEDKLVRILPYVGLSIPSDLDTDDPLKNPRAEIRSILDRLPDDQLRSVLDDLEKRYPHLREKNAEQ